MSLTIITPLPEPFGFSAEPHRDCKSIGAEDTFFGAGLAPVSPDTQAVAV